MKTREQILGTIYADPGILITDLIKASRASVKSGMQIVGSLIKEGIVREELLSRGKKTVTRRLYPCLETEIGRTTFSLVELKRTQIFYDTHPLLAGPLNQFVRNVSADVILVFGSFARGAESKSSDIDLLLLSKRFDKQFKETIEREGEAAFSTVANRPSIRAETFSSFRKNLSDSLHQSMLREHIILRGAAEFVGLVNLRRRQ